MPTLLEARIEALLGDLAEYHGYRTLWLDPRGSIVHAEPDDELDELGFAYVGTLMRPSRDELLAVLRAQGLVAPLERQDDDELEISLELDLPTARGQAATTWAGVPRDFPQAATI